MAPSRALFVFLTLTLTFGIFGAASEPGSRVRVAQGEVRIPSDAQIGRMERDAISTPPLDVSEGRQTGGEGAEIRKMDRRARSIDEKLLKDGGVCRDC